MSNNRRTFDPNTLPWRKGDARADDDDDNDNSETAIPIPNQETMQKRWNFRDTIRRETAEHRRTVPGQHHCERRNIISVLHERERQGGNAMVVFRQPRRKKPHSQESKSGDRSPSTVFESPISTTTRLLYDDDEQTSPTNAQHLRASSQDEEDDPAAGYSHDDTTKNQLLNSEDGGKSKNNNDRIRTKSNFYPVPISREIRTYAEHASALKYQSAFLNHLGGDDVLDEHGNRPTSSWAVSTISIAFSPDAQTMASTHGDHTVKISSCNTGRLLQTLDGHPRTPWTVKYHPTDSSIVASGCLGHQVRIWNWMEKACLQMVRLEYAIISLSFHPTGKVLAIANGTRLHFWGIGDTKMSNTTISSNNNNNNNNDSRAILTEMDQRHMLRCVHFPPNGNTIIIGGVNPVTEDARRRNRGGIGGGGMSFYLRLWDFDLARALNPQSDVAANGISIARRPISNPRTFVPRALLYNDGGFDVSPDGKTLCACAEYWLPEGVDNAMDLLFSEEVPYGADGNNEGPDEAEDAAGDPATVSAETRTAVAEALTKLRGITRESNNAFRGARSPSFREGMDQHSRAPAVPRTPPVPSNTAPSLEFVPQTPPNPNPNQPPRLSPPSPPGRRFEGGLGQASAPQNATTNESSRGQSNTPPPPPPPPAAPPAPCGPNMRPPHPLSVVSRTGTWPDTKGRYVPHVITVSLDTTHIPDEIDLKIPRNKPYGAVASGHRPRLGQLVEACPLDPSKASAVTCVKFSPSTDFCLIGYGVREPIMEGGGNFHPVTAIYRLQGGMAHVSTMLSGDDDVNIARFHPDSGYGFVYGTKQGRVRILSPRPWNYYNC